MNEIPEYDGANPREHVPDCSQRHKALINTLETQLGKVRAELIEAQEESTDRLISIQEAKAEIERLKNIRSVFTEDTKTRIERVVDERNALDSECDRLAESNDSLKRRHEEDQVELRRLRSLIGRIRPQAVAEARRQRGDK